MFRYALQREEYKFRSNAELVAFRSRDVNVLASVQAFSLIDGEKHTSSSRDVRKQPAIPSTLWFNPLFP